MSVNDIQVDPSAVTPVIPGTDLMEDVVMDDQSGAVSMAPKKMDVKGKGKAKGDGGFKENPYTFLSPDDLILQSCMFVGQRFSPADLPIDGSFYLQKAA